MASRTGGPTATTSSTPIGSATTTSAPSQQVIPRVKRLGVEFDHMTLQVRDKLERFFAGIELVDVSAGCMRARMIKSPEEIAVIRNGARIADLGGEAVVAAIGDGVPEYEVALAGTQAMVREIAKTYPHSELMDTWVWFQSGINTDGAHNPVTTRRVRAGDILQPQLLPDDPGLLHGARAHAVLRSLRRRLAAATGRSTSRCTSAGCS